MQIRTGGAALYIPGIGVVQPLGGDLLPFADDFNRADGAIANGWEGGGSTWTISGNKAINTPGLGSELVANGTFATAMTGWSNGTGISSAVVSGEAEVTMGATTAQGVFQANILAVGQWARVSADLRAPATNTVVNGATVSLRPPASIGDGGPYDLKAIADSVSVLLTAGSVTVAGTPTATV